MRLLVAALLLCAATAAAAGAGQKEVISGDAGEAKNGVFAAAEDAVNVDRLVNSEPFSGDLGPLPYDFGALEEADKGGISAKTVELHWGKHTAGYAAKLSAILDFAESDAKAHPETQRGEMTRYLTEKKVIVDGQAAGTTARAPLEDIVVALSQLKSAHPRSAELKNAFNQAAQTLNHAQYFRGLTGSSEPHSVDDLAPGSALRGALTEHFGSPAAAARKLAEAAAKHFGSGWAWLTYDPKTAELEVLQTHDASTPVSFGKKVLVVVDVWEHAYYLDYQNRRPEYVAGVLKAIDWRVAEARFARALQA